MCSWEILNAQEVKDRGKMSKRKGEEPWEKKEIILANHDRDVGLWPKEWEEDPKGNCW